MTRLLRRRSRAAGGFVPSPVRIVREPAGALGALYPWSVQVDGVRVAGPFLSRGHALAHVHTTFPALRVHPSGVCFAVDNITSV